VVRKYGDDQAGRWAGFGYAVVRKYGDDQAGRWAGFGYAVVRKYGDDQAGHYAALLAYYTFLSVFPLLLVLVSVLGIALRDNPDLRGRVLDSGLASFPMIGNQLRAVRLRVATMANGRSPHDCHGADDDRNQDKVGRVLTGIDADAGQPKANCPHEGDQQIQHVIPEIKGAVWIRDQPKVNRCSSSTAHLMLCHTKQSPPDRDSGTGAEATRLTCPR
jgi:Virulence factor BrkB